ncbi:MAG: discoidin domain-containing protein, partial [Mariniphaga sp.]
MKLKFRLLALLIAVMQIATSQETNENETQRTKTLPVQKTPPEKATSKSTFCNPINIDYRFRIDEVSCREAADPVVLLYKGNYYLFASKSGGYWWSRDFLNWNLVQPTTIPLEKFNPAAAVINDELYYSLQLDAFYKTTHPKEDKWTKVRRPVYPSNDHWLFADDDGRVFHYAVNPSPRSHAVRELDPNNNLDTIGPLKPVVNMGFFESKEDLPFTEPIPENPELPHFEGSQMTKHNGLYYFQLSHNPSFCFADYSGDAYVSRSPMGPFYELPNNPVSYRPVGFSTGAANSSWFKDKKGEWWNASTASVCCLHQWERRIALYPSHFDEDDLMYSDTYLADLPQFLPGHRKPGLGGNLVGWMLLSYKKPVKCSSILKHGVAAPPKRIGRINIHMAPGSPKHTVDEDIQSWWSAKTADKGEWLEVDLEKKCRINAIQVNFAEQDTRAFGRKAEDELYHQYTLEVSDNGVDWKMVVDKSNNQTDVPHDYIQLEEGVEARFVRLTNVHMPAHGKFAVRDLRVFGNGLGEVPEPVETFGVQRVSATTARIYWDKSEGAEGYVVRYGIAPDKLYSSQDVRDGTGATLTRLLPEQDYYFVVDSFNDSGISFGTQAKAGK